MKERRLFILITSTFFTLSTCGITAANQKDNSWDNVEKEKELVVAASGALFPASYYNGRNKLAGYDADLAKGVTKRLNVRISFKEHNVDGRTIPVLKRESDFAADDSGITREREKKFFLSKTSKCSFNSMIVRKKDDSEIHSLEDLKGKKTTDEPNTSYIRLTERHEAKLIAYNSTTNDQCLGDVADGRTDVILNDHYLQKMAVSVLPDAPARILENVYFSENESSFLLEGGNDALEKKVDGVLKEMEGGETTKKISEKCSQADASVKLKKTMAESVGE